ncbi:MAG: RloB family protein [Fibrobacteraceae bacterium]|nr:RloB family protein [Fibrobacteraceae bacterium]
MKKLSLSEIDEEEKKQQAQKEAIAAQKKERFVKLTFLIATEGTETEPRYFNALKSELEDSNRFNIDVVVQGKGKSTTNLVNKIIRQTKYNNQEYDRLWAVFDKDDFNDFDAAIKLAGENGINCAWSNECFELWLLLHFQDVSEATGRKDCFNRLEDAIRVALHRTDPDALYDLTKGDPDIYAHTKNLGNEKRAFERIALLKKKFLDCGKKFSEQNPCTHVDELVYELRHPEKVPLPDYNSQNPSLKA